MHSLIIAALLIFLTSCYVPIRTETENTILGTRTDSSGEIIEQYERQYYSFKKQYFIGPDGPVTGWGSLGEALYRIDENKIRKRIEFISFEGKQWYFYDLIPLQEYGRWLGLIMIGPTSSDPHQYSDSFLAVLFTDEKIIFQQPIVDCFQALSRGKKEAGNYRIITPHWTPLFDSSHEEKTLLSPA